MFMVYSSQLHKRPVFEDEHLAHGRRVPSSGNINMKVLHPKYWKYDLVSTVF